MAGEVLFNVRQDQFIHLFREPPLQSLWVWDSIPCVPGALHSFYGTTGAWGMKK